jgi:hypothetical protein
MSHTIESVELASPLDDADALGVAAAESLLQRLGLTTLRGVEWTESEASRTAAP